MWIEEDGRRSGSRERTMWIEWEDDALCVHVQVQEGGRRGGGNEKLNYAIQMCTRG
jgi:hypothetical protein